MSLLANAFPVGLFITLFTIGFGVIVAIGMTVYVLKIVRRSRNAAQSGAPQTVAPNKSLYDSLNAEELYTLALGHINKTVKNSDYFLGKELMKKAAQKGNAQAQFYYADKFCYNDNALAVEFF